LNTGEANSNTLDLTFATQNCNSLNLTTNVKNFELKISAIKGLNTDIIFLCDTRMVSNKGVNSINRVKQALRDSKGKKYKLYANSTKNSRGVAILISFDINLDVTDTCTDPEENYIFLKVNYKGQKLLLGSIYGHNSTSRDFYRRITRILSKNRERKIIMGGDWNTVWDRSPVATNIDTFQMANIPNQKNSELLENLASEVGLFDPYRVLYPTKRNFTYSPFGHVRLNRSRLDFFVVSANVLQDITDCSCDSAVSLKLFDHKSVSLILGNVKQFTKPPPKLKNSNLEHPFVKHSVTIAAILCHTVSLKVNETCNVLGQYNRIIADMRAKIGTSKALLADLVALFEAETINGKCLEIEHRIATKINEIEESYENMVPMEALMSLKKKLLGCAFL